MAKEKNIIAKNAISTFLIVGLFFGAFSGLSFWKYTELKTEIQNLAIENATKAKKEGQLEAVNVLIEQGKSCETMYADNGEERVNLVNVACLQKPVSEKTPEEIAEDVQTMRDGGMTDAEILELLQKNNLDQEIIDSLELQV
ncbi:MAG: hypothetical protein N4A36_02765 [Candidatus Gracilibacteria bacterium]|jgi:hypothetical protein|nr:hypothetical protein [Candidatus Gracilibacteria bacterium]